MNKDGDFAIVKGKWIGFSRKVPGDKKQKAKPGNPGKLQVIYCAKEREKRALKLYKVFLF